MCLFSGPHDVVFPTVFVNSVSTKDFWDAIDQDTEGARRARRAYFEVLLEDRTGYIPPFLLKREER